MPKAKKKTAKKKPSKRRKLSKRKPNPAFMKPVQPDDKLAAIVGSQPLSRPELTKKLWAYIKRHGSRDKEKRTMREADGLKPLFKETIEEFVSKHTDSPGPGRYRGRR